MDLGTRAPGTSLTPYEAPEATHSAASRGAPVFYAIDSRRVTLQECWWTSKSSILLSALLKLFRVKVPSATDDPSVESLLPFEVRAGDVPGVILQRFAVPLQQLKSLGFHSPIWHVIEDDLQRVKTYLVTLVGDTGRVWARVHLRVWHIRTPAKTNLFCELVSETADGRFLWSLSSKADLKAPASCTVLRDVGATPHRLLARHLSELRMIGGERTKVATSPDTLRASIERHHAAVRDFHLARGVFVPFTADEQQSAVAFRSSVKSAQEIGSPYPEILAEVDRLQNQKSSRSNGMLLLLASAALFVGSFMIGTPEARFPLRLLAIIVGVLFVHETGHWVAMRTTSRPAPKVRDSGVAAQRP